MVINERFKLDLAINIIEKLGYKVFATDIQKDEVERNLSFFIYEESGEIAAGQASSTYLREFVLSFITKEEATFNEIELIEQLKRSGLTFKRSSTDYGKIFNSDQSARMTSFIFNYMIKVCG